MIFFFVHVFFSNSPFLLINSTQVGADWFRQELLRQMQFEPPSHHTVVCPWCDLNFFKMLNVSLHSHLPLSHLYSPSCFSKLIRPAFFYETQKEMKFKLLLTENFSLWLSNFISIIWICKYLNLVPHIQWQDTHESM